MTCAVCTVYVVTDILSLALVILGEVYYCCDCTLHTVTR